jgi:hypothetical protein
MEIEVKRKPTLVKMESDKTLNEKFKSVKCTSVDVGIQCDIPQTKEDAPSECPRLEKFRRQIDSLRNHMFLEDNR